jgi:hypothetical protein
MGEEQAAAIAAQSLTGQLIWINPAVHASKNSLKQAFFLLFTALGDCI